MESLEVGGNWWNPSDEGNSVAGALQFNPEEGATLELFGSLPKSGDFEMQTFSVIHGYTKEGPVTLYRCREIRNQPLGPGLPSSIFRCDVVFVGAHFPAVEDIRFASVSASYSHLNDWVRRTGFRLSLPKEAGTDAPDLEIAYKSPPRIETTIDDMKVALDFGVSTTGDGVHDWGLRANTLAIFQATQPYHFDQYWDGICSQFQAYLSFAVGRPIFYLAMNGKWRDTSDKSSEGASVRILFGQRYVSGRYVRPLERTFFGLYDVENGFERTFKRWVERAALLRPIYELYLGNYYNPATYIDQQFLNLAQALESYHRRAYGGQYMPKAAYGSILANLNKAVEANVSEDELALREALKNRIRYGYEFSFKSRLKELLERHTDVVTGVLSNVFVDDVCSDQKFLYPLRRGSTQPGEDLCCGTVLPHPRGQGLTASLPS